VSGTNALASGASRLHDGLEQLRAATAGLPAQTRALADGAAKVADGNARVASTSARVATASTSFVGDMTNSRGALANRLRAAGFDDAQISRILSAADQVAQPVVDANNQVQTANTQLQALATGARQVATGARTLADASTGLSSGIATAASASGELSSGAERLRTGQDDALSGAEQLARGAHELDTGLGKLSPGATQLSEGLASGLKRIPDPSEAQRTAVAQTLGNPVGVKGVSDATAANYGAGLAPFFMSLALWIGGFVLFTRVRPLSDRAIVAGQPAWRVALGGWLAPALLGVVQAALAYCIVAFGLGISAAHPVLLLGFMALVSMTFMMVVHALMARFGLVGQFVGLVVMVLQLVSAGGTFPWQTLPVPLQWLHHVLPMSYTVDGIRRLMYGGSMVHLGLDLAVLGTWAVAAFALGTMGARRAGTWTAKRIKPEVQPA
jgi:putative membrane protein